MESFLTDRRNVRYPSPRLLKWPMLAAVMFMSSLRADQSQRQLGRSLGSPLMIQVSESQAGSTQEIQLGLRHYYPSKSSFCESVNRSIRRVLSGFLPVRLKWNVVGECHSLPAW